MDRAFVKAAKQYCRDVDAGRVQEPRATERVAALKLLLKHAVGKSNAKTNPWIVHELQRAGVSVSHVQDLQQNVWAPLRDKGIFMAWSNRGMYIPNSDEDYKLAVEQYGRRIESERRHVQAARRVWDADR